MSVTERLVVSKTNSIDIVSIASRFPNCCSSCLLGIESDCISSFVIIAVTSFDLS